MTKAAPDAPKPLAAATLPILTYHNVGDVPAGATRPGLHLALDKFRFHLDVLVRLGYRGVSIADGLAKLQGRSDERLAVITFDDGYVDTLELALPALLERGFGATCYLVADRLGRHNTWDSDRLGVEKPLMDEAAARRWLEAGMHVGSHTLDHPHLSRLTSDEKRRQIVDSRRSLEDRFGIAVDHFCYPYGDFDEECVELAAEAGYATAVTTVRGRVRPGDRLHALPRVGNSGLRHRRVFQARALLWGR